MGQSHLCITPRAGAGRAQVLRAQQDHALVPSDQEPQGLCLGPACSLDSSFLPQQGSQQLTNKVPAMS